MEEMEINQKIDHLGELMKNPEQNVAAILRTFHDIFKLTHEGRDLSPESAERLNQTACLFLSPELRAVLVKHRLDVYGFHFAALNFIDVDDVVDDLSNEEILKNSIPPGSYNKLKRDLLSKPSVEPNPPSKMKLETASSSMELETKKINKEEVVEKKPEDNPLYKSLLNNFFAGNKEGVMESLRDFVNDEHFSIKTIEVKNLLKQSAKLLLSVDVTELLEKNLLGEYSYLLAVNHVLELEDLKEDVANGDIIQRVLPQGAFNTLKRQLITQTSLDTKCNHSFPGGAYNKLKRELLSAQQPNSQSRSTLEKASAVEVLMETKPTFQKEPEKITIQEETTEKKIEDGPLYNSLLKNFMDRNKEGVMESLRDFVNDVHSSIKSIEVKNLLKQSAKLLLSTEVTELLEKNLLAEYSYLLAVNHVLELEDLKEDLAGGDVLQRVLPQGAFNNLKRQLATKTNCEEMFKNISLEGAEAISLPLNMSKPQRLAEKLMSHCHFVGKNPSGMELYKLPLNIESQSRSSKPNRWVFGSPSPTKVESKTILVMGATGSGKSTLINAMVNYILGVEWDDPFRFMLITEESNSNQAHSQTKEVTAYELHYQEGFKIPFSLVIVDTPGFGDCRGVQRDYEITDSIQQFFKDDEGIQVLDAVGFTVQAALARLTMTQKYIFESILAIFGYDVRDNIRFLVTFTDGQTPPVLEAIKEAKIPHQLDAHGHPRHHRFNNSGFFTSNQRDGDTKFGKMFWEVGVTSFESFFSCLSLMKTRSLTLTKEVLEERKRINVTIEGLTPNIRKQLTKMEELRQTKQEIENNKDQINAHKNFKYTVPVSRGDKVNISDGKFTTNCSKCSTTCHFPCAYSNDADKRSCSAMGSDGLCTVCTKKCKWDEHTNQPYHWVFKDVVETRTYDDIKKKYEEALQKNLSTEGFLQALQAELDQIEHDLKKDIDTITACLQRLDQIALRPDAFTSTDYIELMIEAETKEKKPGFKERIKSLNSLLEKAEVVGKIRDGKINFRGQTPQVVKNTTFASKVVDRAKQYVYGKNCPGGPAP